METIILSNPNPGMLTNVYHVATMIGCRINVKTVNSKVIEIDVPVLSAPAFRTQISNLNRNTD